MSNRKKHIYSDGRNGQMSLLSKPFDRYDDAIRKRKNVLTNFPVLL